MAILIVFTTWPVGSRVEPLHPKLSRVLSRVKFRLSVLVLLPLPLLVLESDNTRWTQGGSTNYVIIWTLICIGWTLPLGSPGIITLQHLHWQQHRKSLNYTLLRTLLSLWCRGSTLEVCWSCWLTHPGHLWQGGLPIIIQGSWTELKWTELMRHR